MADPRQRLPRIMARPGAGPTVKKLAHDRPRVRGGESLTPKKVVKLPKRLG